jgi:hypothetical protein
MISASCGRGREGGRERGVCEYAVFRALFRLFVVRLFLLILEGVKERKEGQNKAELLRVVRTHTPDAIKTEEEGRRKERRSKMTCKLGASIHHSFIHTVSQTLARWLVYFVYQI